MLNPLVSVIVPTYNSSKFLGVFCDVKSLSQLSFEILTNASGGSILRVLKPPTLLLPESGGFFSSKMTLSPL